MSSQNEPNEIFFDLSKEEPIVHTRVSSLARVSYHYILLNPDGSGDKLDEWKGDNTATIEDHTLPHKGEALKFAPLLWRFDIFPTPDSGGVNYKIELSITQAGARLFNQVYEKTDVENVTIEDGRGIFLPKE